MTKKLPTIKCPECGKKITRDDLKYAQHGEMIYDVSFDEKGEPFYEDDEFTTSGGGEFYHAECGGQQIEYDDLEKLGVNC